QLEELIGGQRIEAHEVPHIDRSVGPQQLAQGRERIAVRPQRLEHATEHPVEAVEPESRLAQGDVDVAEQRLVDIDRDELDLAMDDQRGLEHALRPQNDVELGALDIELDVVDVLDLGNVVEP